MLTIYAFKSCDTCCRALRWLAENEIPHQVRAIRDTPPTPAELETAFAAAGSLRPLFNTSGVDYREFGLKDKLDSMKPADAITMLAENGNLIKRPFAIGEGVVLTGFNPEKWRNALCG